MGQTHCTCIWLMAHSSCYTLRYLSASSLDMLHCGNSCCCRSVGTLTAIVIAVTGTETGIASGTTAAAETASGHEGAAQGLLTARIAHAMSGHAEAARSQLAAAEMMRGGVGAARRPTTAAERMSNGVGAAKSPIVAVGMMSSNGQAARSLLAAGTARRMLLMGMGAPAAATSAAERWDLSCRGFAWGCCHQASSFQASRRGGDHALCPEAKSL